MLRPLLLQSAELAKLGAKVTGDVQQHVTEQGVTHLFFFWTTLLLLAVCGVLSWAYYKQANGANERIEAATKLRLEGYSKAEEILKEKHEQCQTDLKNKHQQALKEVSEKHALEIGINEGNHQSVLKGMQRALDESNAERRDLSDKLSQMAENLQELFDRFHTKLQTFSELQASQIAYLQTLKGEILLEITRLFHKS